METPSSLVEWAPVASAALSAVAALAAWAAVRLNWKQWRASQTPELRGQAVHRQKTDELKFTILNGGAGAARGVGFCVAVGEEYVAGFADPNMGGFLNPGERVTVTTQLTPGEESTVRGVVTCDDVAGYYHSWSIHPVRHRVWRTTFLRRPLKEYPSGKEALQHHHPDINLDQLRRVGGHTPPLEDA